ncbi:hypothetical protein Pelo_14397 [Pelomyxa schiedti]|nr:hypothetical protein Pelo_14397 [Pelomyxa schiedti]
MLAAQGHGPTGEAGGNITLTTHCVAATRSLRHGCTVNLQYKQESHRMDFMPQWPDPILPTDDLWARAIIDAIKRKWYDLLLVVVSRMYSRDPESHRGEMQKCLETFCKDSRTDMIDLKKH